jgi:hypothetical protein
MEGSELSSDCTLITQAEDCQKIFYVGIVPALRAVYARFSVSALDTL